MYVLFVAQEEKQIQIAIKSNKSNFFIAFKFFNVFPSPSGKQVYKKSVELQYLIFEKSNKDENEKKS